MNKYLFLVLTLAFTACAGPEGPQGGAGAPAPAPVVVEPSKIDMLVGMENDYRTLVGVAPLSKGLTCTLYTVPNGTATIVGAALTTVTSFSYQGVINSPDSNAATGVNLLPAPIRPLYTSWYVLSCVGKLVVETSGYYTFDLTSDDGSLLYINGGSPLINNDGNHAQVTKSAMKLLKTGVHDITVKYMSGPGGSQALQLMSAGSPVPAENLYH